MNKNQIRRILIKVSIGNQKALRTFGRAVDSSNKSLNQMNKNLGGIGAAFAGFLSLQGVKMLSQFADEIQLLTDRMAIFTGSSEKAADAFKDLTGAARLTNASVGSLANTYNRIALATSDIGLSSKQVIGLTTALQQTFRLSGATLAEATASSIQLSQGLASGAVRGQELRSVLEANAVFGELLAKQLNITRGQLIKFGETGKITSEVILKFLANNFDDLNERASKLGQTFEQSFIKIVDVAKIAVDRFNKFSGASKIFASFANGLIEGSTASVAILGALAGVAIPATIAALYSLASALGLASVKMALATGGLSLVGAGIALLVVKWDEWKIAIRKGIVEIELYFEKLVLKFSKFQKKLSDGLQGAIVKLGSLIGLEVVKDDSSDFGISGYEKNISKLEKTVNKLDASYKKVVRSKKDAFDVNAIRKEFLKLKNATGIVNTQVKGFAAENLKYLRGELEETAYSTAIYNTQLEELKDQFTSGKIDVAKFREEYEKLQKSTSSSDFFKSLSDSSVYKRGLKDYLDSFKDVNKEISSSINKTFQALEDQLLNFIQKGKFSFTDFRRVIQEEINKILLRQLVLKPLLSPLTQGLNNFDIRGLFNPSPDTSNPFSTGTPGLLSPTSGTVAKTSSTTVNVNNNTPTEAVVKESTAPDGSKTIDVIIEQRVNNAINNGKFDRSLKSSFNLSRRAY
jgi:tape measure domain-containing protein